MKSIKLSRRALLKTSLAIGAGLTLCEIQQWSDTTYRLFDYGRPGRGQLAVLVGKDDAVRADGVGTAADADDGGHSGLTPMASMASASAPANVDPRGENGSAAAAP